MANAGDVADILEIRPKREKSALDVILGPTKKSTPSANKPRKSQITPEERKKGITREVELLRESSRHILSSSNPPIVPGTNLSAVPPETSLVSTNEEEATAIIPGLKERRKIETRTADDSHWVLNEFSNPGRRSEGSQGKLILKHWVRRSEIGDSYEFARYSRGITVLKYNEAQYQRLFNDDVKWNKEETDLLLELCERFDLRWPVISDRFGENKTMEELKERFYIVQSKLAKELLNSQTAAATTTSLNLNQIKVLSGFEFNRRNEEERKALADRLFRRTPAQIHEEEELLQVLLRIEQQTTLGKKKTLKKQQTTPNSLISMIGRPKKKRKTDEDDEDEDVHAELSGEEGEEGIGSRKPASNSVKVVPHVMLRSSLLLHSSGLSNNKELGKQVQEILDRHGVGVVHVATEAAVNAFVELRKNILKMIELQKHIGKKEYVVSLLQQQLAQATKP